MDDLNLGQGGNRPGNLRGRIILLVVLPPAVLGATFLLLIEYVFQNQPAAAHLSLRLGGIVLTALALILAAACGYLLGDRVTRPIRLLLFLAERGELPPSRAAFLEEGNEEIGALYRTVSVLVSQNKAGAQALEELESLRSSLSQLREAVGRAGQHGIPPPMESLPNGTVSEIASMLESKRSVLMSFFHDLHDRVVGLRSEIEALGCDLGFTAGGPAPSLPRLDPEGLMKARDSMARCQRIATVLSLESARLTAGSEDMAEREQRADITQIAPDSSGRIHELLARFHAGLGDLVALLQHIEDASAAARDGIHLESGRDHWVHLLEGLDALERRLGEVEEPSGQDGRRADT